jgi:hypothetical protein
MDKCIGLRVNCLILADVFSGLTLKARPEKMQQLMNQACLMVLRPIGIG